MAKNTDYIDIPAGAQDQAEENEAFVGTEPNETAMGRLRMLRDFCGQLAAGEAQIKHPATLPDNRAKNGRERLILPSALMLTDPRARDLMSALFRGADDVFLSIGEDGGIILSFCIRNIWKN